MGYVIYFKRTPDVEWERIDVNFNGDAKSIAASGTRLIVKQVLAAVGYPDAIVETRKAYDAKDDPIFEKRWQETGPK